MKTLATLFALCFSIICTPVFAKQLDNRVYIDKLTHNESHILGYGLDPANVTIQQADGNCQSFPVYNGGNHGCYYWLDKVTGATWLTVHQNGGGGPQGYGYIVGLYKQEPGAKSFTRVQTWSRRINQVETRNERGTSGTKLVVVLTPENGNSPAVANTQKQNNCAGRDLVSILKSKDLGCLGQENSTGTGTNLPAFSKGGKK